MINQVEILQKIDAHIEANQDYWMGQLARLCAQPSVSAQNWGIDECAQLVATMLQEQGYTAEVLPSDGYPVVVGGANGRSPNGHDPKTMLLYLHYDVQPPDPLELWESDPFTLTERDGKLVARGISDDKGHIICRLAALAAIKDTLGELPCHIKFIIEGEEEIGSPNMPAFVENNQELLAADGCIWEFGGVDYDGRPRQALGMRGICYVELTVQSISRDAHSGLGGSIFPNAAWRLTWALNTLKDQNERILIPGFYANVLPPSRRDLELLENLPDDAPQLKEMFGLDAFLLGLEGGLELQRTAVFEPTCTICGLTSGYQGAGTKTVLPAKASAKVDFRLVPNQTPQEIVAKLRAHLDAQGFTDVEVKLLGGGRPAKVDPDDPLVHIANETAVEVYGMEPIVEPIIGGSGPNYPFIHTLGLPLISAGVGYPGSNVHAPNENMTIENFLLGTKHTARIIERFSR